MSILKLPENLNIIIIIYKNPNINLTILSKKTNKTFNYITKIINSYEKLKILESKKFGRKRKIKLTPKGLTLGKILIEYNKFL